jgi:hypothetical protein
MAHLNGWQRVWVVVMALAGLAVGAFTYLSLPTYVWNPDGGRTEEVVARMPSKTWKGDTCKVKYQITLTSGRTLIVDNDLFDQQALDDKEGPVYLDGKGNPIDLSGFRDINLGQLKKVLQRMIDAGEPERNVKLVTSAYAAHQITRVHIPLEGSSQTATLCFSKEVSQSEMERISAEYRASYGETLRARRLQHAGIGLAVWCVSGAFLYAFGWSVGWIRRGFNKNARPDRSAGVPFDALHHDVHWRKGTPVVALGSNRQACAQVRKRSMPPRRA